MKSGSWRMAVRERDMVGGVLVGDEEDEDEDGEIGEF
jgi:hypothetical protein